MTALVIDTPTPQYLSMSGLIERAITRGTARASSHCRYLAKLTSSIIAASSSRVQSGCVWILFMYRLTSLGFMQYKRGAAHRRMRRGGQLPPPNSGKQWVKFGQTVGEIRAKQEEKIGQRKLQINPFGMWMMTSHRQCPRGGACECPRVGVFFKFWEGG